MLETFVAITILAFAMVAPLSIASSTLASVRYARDQIIAFYLGSEAVEYARNIRDRNNQAGFNESTTWLTGFDLCLGEDGCLIDSINNQILPPNACGQSDCYLNFQNGVYSYGNGQPTIFKRLVKMSVIGGSGGEEVALDVTVTWRTKGFPERKVVLRETLHNWQI